MLVRIWINVRGDDIDLLFFVSPLEFDVHGCESGLGLVAYFRNDLAQSEECEKAPSPVVVVDIRDRAQLVLVS